MKKLICIWCFFMVLILSGSSILQQSGVAEARIIVENVVNSLTTPLSVDCKTVNVDYGSQTVAAGEGWGFTVVASEVDPSVECVFKDGDHAVKTVEIWNYARSGYSDVPWYNCDSSCTWEVKEDGFYYLSQETGNYKLYSSW
ncbi:unnamed protein product [Sphagnum compactum]